MRSKSKETATGTRGQTDRDGFERADASRSGDVRGQLGRGPRTPAGHSCDPHLGAMVDLANGVVDAAPFASDHRWFGRSACNRSDCSPALSPRKSLAVTLFVGAVGFAGCSDDNAARSTVWGECAVVDTWPRYQCRRLAHSTAVRVKRENQPSALLVYEPGGPGLSGAKRLESVIEIDSRLVDQYDLVALERQPADPPASPKCSSAVARILENGLDSNLDEPTPVASACEGQSQPTVAVVDDIAQLARDGGYTSVSFLGVSYGSTTAVLFAERFPELIGRIALDSPAPIGPTWRQSVSDAVDTLEAAGRDAGDACLEGGAACSAEFGVESLAERVVACCTPNRGVMQIGLISLLRDWPASAELLQQVLEDPGLVTLEVLGSAQVGSTEALADAVTSRLSIECADLAIRPTVAQARAIVDELKAAGRWLAAIAASQTLFCATDSALRSAQSVQSSREPETAGVPTLVVASRDDRVVPFRQQRSLATAMDADFVAVDGNHHALLGVDQCATSALIDFLLGSANPAECQSGSDG